MIARIVLTFLICQLSLACFAKDYLAFNNLKKRQIESPIYYSNTNKKFVDKKIKAAPKVRAKHHESINIFNYNVSFDNKLKDVDKKAFTTSLKPLSLSEKTGQLTLGSTYYGSEHKAKNTQSNTYGLFSDYKLGRFSFQTKYARYTDRDFENPDDKLYFTPRVELTRNLAIKIRHQKKMEVENYKNDFILEYSLRNNPILKIENMKLELNASYVNDSNQEQQKQVGARAKYYF